MHSLKCWPQEFDDVRSGRKKVEVRRNDDRAFSVGDQLLLQCYDPDASKYTGDDLLVKVTHIVRHAGNLGLFGDDGEGSGEIPMVALSIELVP